MSEDKKICPLMRRDGPQIYCEEGECALWDPLLKCCSHMSHLIEGRVSTREIMAEFVDGFQEDQVTAEGKLADAEEKYEEAQKVDTALDVMEAHRERIGELRGKIDIIQQVCDLLKRRFMV